MFLAILVYIALKMSAIITSLAIFAIIGLIFVLLFTIGAAVATNDDYTYNESTRAERVALRAKHAVTVRKLAIGVAIAGALAVILPNTKQSLVILGVGTSVKAVETALAKNTQLLSNQE